MGLAIRRVWFGYGGLRVRTRGRRAPRRGIARTDALVNNGALALSRGHCVCRREWR
jgi:hypothetical protein